MFVPGQTNPLIFLKNFENSPDIKSGKDKMYKLLDFVEEFHIGIKLFTTSLSWRSILTPCFSLR